MKRNRRKTRSSKLRRTVVTILIVAILVVIVGAFLVMQCLTFDEDGAHVIDRYGVMTDEEKQSLSTETITYSSAADDDSDEADEVEADADEEEEDEEPEEQARMVLLSTSDMANSSVIEQLIERKQNGELDTVIIDIKNSDGLLYLSCDSEAIDTTYLTSSYADQVEDAIAQLRQAEIRVIGRIYCLHDDQAAQLNADLAMQYLYGGTWLDYESSRWLDPTDDDVLQYLCDIATNAVEAGCDELVLADLTFPPRGHLDLITFDSTPDDQMSVLTDILKRIQLATDVPVGLMVDSADDLASLLAGEGNDDIEIGDTEDLLAAADQVFVSMTYTDEDTVAYYIDAAQEVVSDASVVPIFTDLDTWLLYSGDAALSVVADRYMLYEDWDTEETDSYSYEDGYSDTWEEEDDYDDSW